MLSKFFLTMLGHCFREEQDGWRVWVETTAAIHFYVGLNIYITLTLLIYFTNLYVCVCNALLCCVQTVGKEDQLEDSLDASSVTDLQSTSVGSLPDNVQELPDETELVLPVIVQEDASETDSASDGSTKADAGASAKQRTISPLVHSSNSSSPSLPRRNSGGNSSRPSSARKLVNQPSPVTLSAIPISRSSSSDTPNSPFLIPRIPFVTLSGKMPKFEWNTVHTTLLERLLKLLCSITSKWSG